MNVVNEFVILIEGLGYQINYLEEPNLIGNIYIDSEKLCTLFKNGELTTNAFSELSKVLVNVKEYLIKHCVVLITRY